MRTVLLAMECADLGRNLVRHLSELTQAAAVGADLVVFPEFSLTGSVDPSAHPERAMGLGDPAVRQLVAATGHVAAVFGLAERDGGRVFITQVAASAGRIVAVQRKRYLGEGEEHYTTGAASPVFSVNGRRCGLVICAEAGHDAAWDACATAGSHVILFCSAPGLHGRRTDEDGWRSGLSWWESCGLVDARRHARRLGVWVGVATQAGSTADEDFPGLAALVSPNGDVVARTPDWRSDRLLVEIPPA